MAPALIVSEDEMETALRIFGEAVAAVAGEARTRSCAPPRRAGAITGVEEAI